MLSGGCGVSGDCGGCGTIAVRQMRNAGTAVAAGRLLCGDCGITRASPRGVAASLRGVADRVRGESRLGIAGRSIAGRCGGD